MAEFKAQISRKIDGYILNAQSDDPNETLEILTTLEALLADKIPENEEPVVEHHEREPFTDDGIETYKKKDGTTGYKLPKGQVPKKCPVCGGDDFKHWEDTGYGESYSCNDCYKNDKKTYINISK